jgi:hypothetical protein
MADIVGNCPMSLFLVNGWRYGCWFDGSDVDMPTVPERRSLNSSTG